MLNMAPHGSIRGGSPVPSEASNGFAGDFNTPRIALSEAQQSWQSSRSSLRSQRFYSSKTPSPCAKVFDLALKPVSKPVTTSSSALLPRENWLLWGDAASNDRTWFHTPAPDAKPNSLFLRTQLIRGSGFQPLHPGDARAFKWRHDASLAGALMADTAQTNILDRDR